MKNSKKLTKIALSVLMASGLAQQVSASLYVSPVVRKSVTYDVSETQESVITSSIAEDSELIKTSEMTDSFSGFSSEHGDFLMKETRDDVFSLMNTGKNVPLFVAVEKVVPESSDWFIHIDQGLENTPVSWRGGDSWEGILNAISEQNNISIEVNHEERAIGISNNENIANHLAKQTPDIWKMEQGLSLRENLAAWSKRAGWTLHWDENIKSDFQIEHSVVLTGEFVGSGGVVERVLDSLKQSKKPLKPKFYKLNNVLFITEAGYKQEVLY